LIHRAFRRLAFQVDHPMYGIVLGFPIPMLLRFIPMVVLKN